MKSEKLSISFENTHREPDGTTVELVVCQLHSSAEDIKTKTRQAISYAMSNISIASKVKD